MIAERYIFMNAETGLLYCTRESRRRVRGFTYWGHLRADGRVFCRVNCTTYRNMDAARAAALDAHFADRLRRERAE